MTYEHALIAAGESPDNAAVLAQREEYLRLTNREHPAYGVTIYGGGGVESRHAQSAGSAAPECGSDGVRVVPYLNRVSPSRSSALPASTLHDPDPPSPAEVREAFALKY